MPLFYFLGLLVALLVVPQVCFGYGAINYPDRWNNINDDGKYIIPIKLDGEKVEEGANAMQRFNERLGNQLEDRTCLRIRSWDGEESWLNLQTKNVKGCFSFAYGRPKGGRNV